jgi:hypothetical protein
MARKIDLRRLKRASVAQILGTLARYSTAKESGVQYLLLRWIAQMSVVEIHSSWERYAEARLVAALNHDPSYFLQNEGIKGVTSVSTGLADFVVRSGRRFFDFRSSSELINKGTELLGKGKNPFVSLTPLQRDYLDCVAAIRNFIVHGSGYSKERYRGAVNKMYGIKYAPAPDEFLNTLDSRKSSPAKWQPRLRGLALMVQKSVEAT